MHLISELQPADHSSPGLPGTAITSRLYEAAMSAVMSAPPFIPDSMIRVASEMPAMMRFRLMKLLRSGNVGEEKSVTCPPFSSIALATPAWTDG